MAAIRRAAWFRQTIADAFLHYWGNCETIGRFAGIKLVWKASLFVVSNLERHFGSAEKVASCIIEHDLEQEMVLGTDECLHVYTNYGNRLIELGYFIGAHEFEEWLCSDLPYEEWRNCRRSD